MAIKSGVSDGVIPVLVTDTAIFEQDSIANLERYAVESAILHNTTASTISGVEIYESPDLTSSAGSRLGSYSLGAGQSKDIIEIVGQGFKDKNLIAKAPSFGVNSLITVTTYDDGD